jgi:4,5-epoxidase
VSYRSGPLGAGRAERIAARLVRRPCVGDRVPNLACAHPDGRPTHLYAELGGRWALFVPPDSVPGSTGPAATGPTGVEPTRLVRTDGIPEAWLVRPDGHLAWRGTDPAGAAPALAGLLGAGRAR